MSVSLSCLQKVICFVGELEEAKLLFQVILDLNWVFVIMKNLPPPFYVTQ